MNTVARPNAHTFGKVLVVDDEESIRYTLNTFLTEEGYDVTVAGDVTEAGRLIRSGVFDVAIVDRMLPNGQSGVDLIKNINDRHPDCETILISAYPSFESAQQSLALGVNAYLTKPFSQKDVCDVVKTAVEKQRDRKENRLLKTIFNISPNPVEVIGLSGNTVFASPSFSALFGYSEADLTGFQSLFIPAYDMEKTLEELWDVFSGHAVAERQTERLTKSGEVVHVVKSMILCSDDTGNPSGAVVMYRDVTRQTRLESELAQSEKLGMLGRISAQIAHEIKNLLTPIYFYSQILCQDQTIGNTSRERSKKMYQASLMIKRLAEELADIARPKPMTLSDINPVAPIEKTCNFLHDTGVIKDCKIEKRFEEIPVCITGDACQLQQVFMNLMMNAAYAMKDAAEKRIVVAAKHDRAGNAVSVSVSDSGCGISEANQKKIFDPFFTTRGSSNGTGLGLSVVKNIVEKHGGSITVESTPGMGSTFTVILPVAGSKSGLAA